MNGYGYGGFGFIEEMFGTYSDMCGSRTMTDDRAFELHRAREIRDLQAKMLFQRSIQKPPQEESIWE
jgi:hypothetical protein